tara:strand:+ start:2643 stop:3848 length:1206 start_codon:yes stop_codon:yes gene_type:complete
MSEIRVDKIISHAGNSAPDFPQGANLSGVTTVSSMKVGSGITADSSGLNVTGIVTASGFVGGVTGNVTGSSSPTVKINDGATEKGYIGFNGNDPFIGRKDGVGLAFQNNKVRPVDGDDGSASNNTVDLGEPTYKFKDLHLAGDASIAGSISGVSSVTATTFYGSAAGLTNQSGGLDAVDVWKLQGNANQRGSTGLFTTLKQEGTSAATVCCKFAYFTCKDMSDRPKWFTGPAVGAGITYVQQEATGYTSNTDCHSGKDYDRQALAAVIKFPSTGLWRIDWNVISLISSSCQLRVGIECSADVGAATTVWTGLYPDNWNCCNVSDPSWYQDGSRNGIGEFSALCNAAGSATASITKNICVLVSVANTAQTGIRYSYWRDRSATQPTNQTTWSYTKISNSAPW